jgi:hypothetical protein
MATRRLISSMVITSTSPESSLWSTAWEVRDQRQRRVALVDRERLHRVE